MASKGVHRTEMTQKFAEHLFTEGAAIVLLNVPVNTQIGIDMHSWNVGPKFKGIKMIPPGLHYIYYSAVSKQHETAPPTGFFHYFSSREVLVKVYLPDTEEFQDESEEQTERVRANLRSLDAELGPYPVDTWRRWVSLSQHINQHYLESVLPSSGIVSSVPTMVPVDNPSKSCTLNSDARKQQKTHDTVGGDCSTSSSQTPHCGSSLSSQITPLERPNPAQYESLKSFNFTENVEISPELKSNVKTYKSNGLPELKSVLGMDFRWYELPKQAYKKGASPIEITAASLDSSYLLQCLIDHVGSPSYVVGELQLSFVVFLVAQCWTGWERWRSIIDVICRAEAGLLQHPQVYSDIMGVLHYQIQEVPEDLFVDIVEQNNFLAASLSTLFANISDNGSELPGTLVERALKFRAHLTSRFGWNLDFAENEEDAPVVVELTE